jgi:hypothetical protein
MTPHLIFITVAVCLGIWGCHREEATGIRYPAHIWIAWCLSILVAAMAAISEVRPSE